MRGPDCPPPEPTMTAGDWMVSCPHACACEAQRERCGMRAVAHDVDGWEDELGRAMGCGEDCEWME